MSKPRAKVEMLCGGRSIASFESASPSVPRHGRPREARRGAGDGLEVEVAASSDTTATLRLASAAPSVGWRKGCCLLELSRLPRLQGSTRATSDARVPKRHGGGRGCDRAEAGF